MDSVLAADTARVLAVSGTAGVGKTALAVRWAHSVASRFPDGCLYLDMRGFDPDEPADAGTALASVLLRLGMPLEAVPEEPEARAALYRSQLAGKRLLLVLDNALDTEHVRLLLPGSVTCLTVVTSRNDLAGLRDRYGAHRIDLDVPDLGEAVTLLRGLLRDDAVEGRDLEALAQRCGCLPLALRVAAGWLTDQPDLSVAGVMAQLAGAVGDGDTLDRSALPVVFSWSYRRLDDSAARLFRLLGSHPGPTFDPTSVAALADKDLADAGRLLRGLARIHMIEDAGVSRYRMHDLLRDYAASTGALVDDESTLRSALARLLDHYLAGVIASTEDFAPRDEQPKDPDTVHRALAWLDTERAVLVRCVAYATQHGWQDHACRLAEALRRYLLRGAHHLDAVAIHSNAIRAAQELGHQRAESDARDNYAIALLPLGRYEEAVREFGIALRLDRLLGDRAIEARTIGHLGTAYAYQQRNIEAVDCLEHHLALSRELGNRHEESIALNNLGLVHLRQARYALALDRLLTGLAITRQTQDVGQSAFILNNLGLVYQRQGRIDQARQCIEEALTLADRIGERRVKAQALDSLGLNRSSIGRHGDALDLLHEALDLHREVSDRGAEAETLTSIGTVLHRTDRHRPALEYHLEALTIARNIANREITARALNGAAAARHALGRSADARRDYESARTLAEEIDNADEQARALTGLADVSLADRDSDAAVELLGLAIDIYDRLGAPEADELRRRSAEIVP